LCQEARHFHNERQKLSTRQDSSSNEEDSSLSTDSSSSTMPGVAERLLQREKRRKELAKKKAAAAKRKAQRPAPPGRGHRRQTTVAWPAVHSTLEGLDLRICRCTSQWDMPEMAKTMNISCIYISKIVCRPSQKLLKCNTQTEKDLYSTQSSSNSL